MIVVTMEGSIYLIVMKSFVKKMVYFTKKLSHTYTTQHGDENWPNGATLHWLVTYCIRKCNPFLIMVWLSTQCCRVFGAIVYVYVHEHHRSKIDDRCFKRRFIGYGDSIGMKAYKIYNSKNDR